MKNKFELLVFDWDGTLINSIDWIVQCIQQAAADCQCRVPSVIESKNQIGLSLQAAMENLFPEADEIKLKQLMRVYSDIYGSWQIGQKDLFDGVYETLAILRDRGYQLAVATGKSRTGLEHALNATGMAGLFTSTRCADETASKPNPLMLQEIMQHVGMSPERTLMIGDSVHDLQMSGNAGVACIAVSCGVNDKATLKQYKPLHCLQNTHEILNLC